MANPSYPSLSEKKWTLVSSAVINIIINRINTHYTIWCTYVISGSSAPADTLEIRNKSIKLFESSELFMRSYSNAVDVYLWIENSDSSSDDMNVENIIRVDTETNDFLSGIRSFSKDALISSNYFDNYIVLGKCHQISRRFSLAQNEVLYIAIDTSLNTRRMFLLPLSFSTDAGKANIDSYNITSYTSGSAIQASPLNEVSNQIPQTVVKSGITPTGTPGVDLREYVIGSPGNVQQSRGGSFVGFNSLILNNGIKVIKITNLHSGTNVLNLIITWCEI